MISGKDEATCSETTVEIKIKTLDSQTYTLRVDKCVPVPALKEQIALVTGVLSEQQRLICRGKVLKDDQLLSAYHVEDGHTLHLVVRQPITTPSESSLDADTDPASTSGRSQRGPGVLVGSFNISEQDGGFPDLSRVVSAVLGSIGLTSVGSGSESIDLNELPAERLSAAPGFSSLRISSRNQAGQADARRQAAPVFGASPHATVDTAESLQPPVIPDSLTTLSQNLNRLRQEFLSIGHTAGIHERNGQNLGETSYSSVQRGLPTPGSLADVMLTTRHILNEQAAECLLQLARQLESHANVTDTSERMRIHSSALRSGILFQNLGAMLLELGRTTMTLRMGETPADAVVNAGPAVFLSSNGPNPIMVQPLPFQPGTGLGAISGGSVQQSPGLSGGSVGSGAFPRNIDIRIRTVGSFMPSNVNRRDSAGAQNPGQTAPTPTASSHGNSVQQQATAVVSGPRESEVRVVPMRTVIAAVPASGSRTSSDPSRSGMGIIYPVIARVQHIRASQASDPLSANAVDIVGQSIPDSVSQQDNIGIPVVDSSSSSFGEVVTDGQGLPPQVHSRISQLLRTMFPGENVQIVSGDRQGMDSNPVTVNLAAAQNADNSSAAATGEAAATSDEGTFLSNVLRQIMPIISGNTEADSNTLPSEAHSFDNGNGQDSTQDQENAASRWSSSERRDDLPSQSSSKRQRRE